MFNPCNDLQGKLLHPTPGKISAKGGQHPPDLIPVPVVLLHHSLWWLPDILSLALPAGNQVNNVLGIAGKSVPHLVGFLCKRTGESLAFIHSRAGFTHIYMNYCKCWVCIPEVHMVHLIPILAYVSTSIWSLSILSYDISHHICHITAMPDNIWQSYYMTIWVFKEPPGIQTQVSKLSM